MPHTVLWTIDLFLIFLYLMLVFLCSRIALEVSADMGADLEALREELFFAVCQVGDFAISNQVYVFNEEDLKQVKLLREADSSEGELSADDKDMQMDEDEVKRVAEEGRKLVADLEAIVDRIVKFTM